MGAPEARQGVVGHIEFVETSVIEELEWMA